MSTVWDKGKFASDFFFSVDETVLLMISMAAQLNPPIV